MANPLVLPASVPLTMSWTQRTLFDVIPDDPIPGEPQPVEDSSPVVPGTIANRIAASVQDLFTAVPGLDAPPPRVSFASGEKAKARDILAAVRALKTIEEEKRAATAEERKTLARFAGFGPVALSIFPHPVSGRYRDAAWETIGDELKSLMTPQEYESAKRTTFNAFYTSPTVIAAMHEAMRRLGLPDNARILEPLCGRPHKGSYVA